MNNVDRFISHYFSDAMSIAAILAVYRNTILPQIKAYTRKKIFQAFEKKRRESDVSQLKQADLFN